MSHIEMKLNRKLWWSTNKKDKQKGKRRKGRNSFVRWNSSSVWSVILIGNEVVKKLDMCRYQSLVPAKIWRIAQ